MNRYTEVTLVARVPGEAIKVNGLIFARMGKEYPIAAVDYLNGGWVAYAFTAIGICRFAFQIPPIVSLKAA